MVNIKVVNVKGKDMEMSERFFKGESHGNSISDLCSCGRFKAPKGRIKEGNHLRIDEALVKLRRELSEMQEQDKGIFQQLMKVSANVDRLRREIRLEEDTKRRLENDNDSDSDSDDVIPEHEDDDVMVYEKPISDPGHVTSLHTAFVPSPPQKGIVDHQRCDSGIMADESDTEVLSTSLNISQRRKMFESTGTPTKSSAENNVSRPVSKCTVTVVDSSNLRRTHIRSKSDEGQIDLDRDLVRLGKFQVHIPDEVDVEKRSANPIVDSSLKDDSVRYSLRKKNGGGGVRDGLLVDISETGELKLHNNIKAVQKTAEARHSEVRKAVFATLNSVQTRKLTREKASSRDDLTSETQPAQSEDKYLSIKNNNVAISHSHSSNGIARLQAVKREANDIPRSRSMDGILDSNAEEDFVDYDDARVNGENEMPFRRYSSCNYGNRNPVQVEARASGRIGYNRTSDGSNAMEDDAKAYFEALKSKKVMIRSISSASII